MGIPMAVKRTRPSDRREKPTNAPSIPKERQCPADETGSPRLEREKTRWPLAAMIGVSLAAHLALGWGLSGVQIFKTTIVHDLQFDSPPQPPPRIIPRPHTAQRETPSPDGTAGLQTYKASAVTPPPPAATAKPISAAAPSGAGVAGILAGLTSGSEAAVSIPAVPGVSIGAGGTHISQGSSGSGTGIGDGTGGSDYSTSQTYLEIVKLKIEKNKKYPENAKRRQMEGTVTLKFIITASGDIRNTEIEKSSRHAVLDDAALKALENAAPFPRPPVRFFSGDVPIQISIVFELI